ncbi:hypothetical protein EV182_000749, partial [Spiromyces aspiralis]
MSNPRLKDLTVIDSEMAPILNKLSSDIEDSAGMFQELQTQFVKSFRHALRSPVLSRTISAFLSNCLSRVLYTRSSDGEQAVASANITTQAISALISEASSIDDTEKRRLRLRSLLCLVDNLYDQTHPIIDMANVYSFGLIPCLDAREILGKASSLFGVALEVLHHLVMSYTTSIAWMMHVDLWAMVESLCAVLKDRERTLACGDGQAMGAISRAKELLLRIVDFVTPVLGRWESDSNHAARASLCRLATRLKGGSLDWETLGHLQPLFASEAAPSPLSHIRVAYPSYVQAALDSESPLMVLLKPLKGEKRDRHDPATVDALVAGLLRAARISQDLARRLSECAFQEFVAPERDSVTVFFQSLAQTLPAVVTGSTQLEVLMMTEVFLLRCLETFARLKSFGEVDGKSSAIRNSAIGSAVAVQKYDVITSRMHTGEG